MLHTLTLRREPANWRIVAVLTLLFHEIAMILKTGEKIHVIHRQLHEGDARRHFVATVDACEHTLARASGYLFALDKKTNRFARHGSARTRIIPLDSGEIIVNVLPESVSIENITYKYLPGGELVVTDNSDWHLDLTHL